MRKRRAISPAITVMLLMAVAVAGALAVSQGLNSQTQIANKITKLDLIDASLTKLQVPGKAYYALTIKNSGTTEITDVEVGFFDNNNNLHSLSAGSLSLQPGQQWSDDSVLDADINVNAKYTLSLSGVASDGSEFNTASTITALG